MSIEEFTDLQGCEPRLTLLRLKWVKFTYITQCCQLSCPLHLTPMRYMFDILIDISTFGQVRRLTLRPTPFCRKIERKSSGKEGYSGRGKAPRIRSASCVRWISAANSLSSGKAI